MSNVSHCASVPNIAIQEDICSFAAYWKVESLAILRVVQPEMTMPFNLDTNPDIIPNDFLLPNPISA